MKQAMTYQFRLGVQQETDYQKSKKTNFPILIKKSHTSMSNRTLKKSIAKKILIWNRKLLEQKENIKKTIIRIEKHETQP